MILLFIKYFLHIQIAPNIPKCRPDDGVCLSRVLTQLLQNYRGNLICLISKDFVANYLLLFKMFSEYPELNLPDLQLYQPRQTWTSQSVGYEALKFIRYTAHASDLSIYGINNLQVHQIKYVYDSLLIEKIETVKLFLFFSTQRHRTMSKLYQYLFGNIDSMVEI